MGQGRGALQDIDQMSLFKPLCKFCASIRTVRDVIPTMRRALAVAQSGTPGPVFIEFPIDTLYPFHLVSKEFGVTNPPKGLMGKGVSWYVSCMSETKLLSVSLTAEDKGGAGRYIPIVFAHVMVRIVKVP